MAWCACRCKPKAFQKCKFCAALRDGLLTEGPASSSSQIEERVRTLETLVENLQQAQSSSATLVENLEQQLVQALQRVAELEATVGNRQQWNEQWGHTRQQWGEN